jgi:hypothetical protein
MNDHELRVRALELATGRASHGEGEAETLARAAKFYDFMTGVGHPPGSSEDGKRRRSESQRILERGLGWST